MRVCSVTQSRPTLCSPMDCSPPGSSVHGIFQQEYWSGLPFPSPGDLPNPGIKLTSLSCIGMQILTTSATGEARFFTGVNYFFLGNLKVQGSRFSPEPPEKNIVQPTPWL